MKRKAGQFLDGQTYDIFDITKFIMSLAVVAIHTNLFPTILYPWLRVAVPLFFVISSYLFFHKIDLQSPTDCKKTLAKFIKRNTTLYFSWFVIQLPLTLYVRQEWFTNGIISGLFNLIKNVFFGSTFFVSWFFSANLIAIVIIYFATKKINSWILLIISVLCNLLCCIISGYNTEIPFVASLNEYISPFFGNIANTFIVALFWVVVGKMFAEKRVLISQKASYIGLLISAVFLFLEWKITTVYLDSPIDRECLFMLIPVVIFGFSVLLGHQATKNRYAKYLRNSSTLIYVTHYPLMIVAEKALSIFNITTALLIFLLTLCETFVLCYTVIKLSNNTKFGFLKNLF